MNKNFILALAAGLLVSTTPAHAVSTTHLKSNLNVTGTLAVTGAQTFTGNQTVTGNQSVSGNEAVTGTLTVTGATTLTTPLTAANIQSGSAKRELLTWTFAQNIATQTAADSTTYSHFIFPGRAGIVKKVTFGCHVAPTVGTDTIKVLKAATNGNTMLSAATYDANSLTADTAATATLSSTSADLAVTATQAIYVEYAAGSQTADAVDLSVTVEFEPTDF